MPTSDGYFRQVKGLAMKSPPAQHLANGWLSKYDAEVKSDAKLFSRYINDILRYIGRIHTEICLLMAHLQEVLKNLLCIANS